MFEVKGIPILVDEIEILQELKKQVYEKQGKEILRKIKRSGDNIMICCPNHNDGQERNPSCGITTIRKGDKPSGTIHCLGKETEVITYDGVYSISDIINKDVQVLNGKGEWEHTRFVDCGVQELYNITIKRNGVTKVIRATSEHLWKVLSRKDYCKTSELLPNHRLAKIYPMKKNFEFDVDAIRHGFIYGDGRRNSKNSYKAEFFTIQKEQLIEQFFKDFEIHKGCKTRPYPYCNVQSIVNLKKLPTTTDLKYLYSFIVGWFAADGNICSRGIYSISSAKETDIDFLVSVLPRLGIAHFGKRHTIRPAGTTYCDYETVLWSLSFVVSTLPDNFIVREHSQKSNNRKTKYERLGWTVVSVEPTQEIENVYCCETSTQTFALKDFILTHNCFACNYVDTLQGMISKCFGYEDNGEYGTKWLLENFISGEQYERPLPNLTFYRDKETKIINYVNEEELSKYRFYHPYMFKRRLTEDVIEKYDIGYQKDYIHEEGWNPTEVITFPVKDINGNCLFVSRRSIHGKTFFLPKNISKPVYGIYELPKDCKEAIICESVFNALTCVAYGKPALAIFGTGDKEQYEVLNKLPIRKYILALDPDEAGEKGVKKLKYNIKGKILTKLIIPKGKDINDLSYEEFINLQEIFI